MSYMPRDICDDCKHCKWMPTEDPWMGGVECELDKHPEEDDCDDFEFTDGRSE